MGFLQIKEINDLEIDSIERTVAHGKIIQQKQFLKSLYIEWYNKIKLFSGYHDQGKYIELGSGAGFIKQIMPRVITSDVVEFPGVDKIVFGEDIPFESKSVDGIFMVDVFHHIPDVASFLKEAERVLKPGGVIVMSEPWNSVWGKFIYSNFHHEPFETEGEWKLPGAGPLSSANGALPWIVFQRDIQKFEVEFPDLMLEKITYHSPLRYLVSGGVSMKQLVPDFSFGFFSLVDKLFASKSFSMFAFIVIRKK